ncbi:hypothetical protein [Phenylobacterium sp.]|uniref:hypothetical protein n=1 Tax=Phenylobacterium sp. TaxID=1871053 RepID=UPI0035B06F2E
MPPAPIDHLPFYSRDLGRLSSAAGRYQIIAPTWEGLTRAHPDLTDFSPANQDMGAWYLASDTYGHATGGRDLASDLRDPNRYSEIAGALHGQWTSLPGGAEEGQDQSEFARRMTDALGRYQTTSPGR